MRGCLTLPFRLVILALFVLGCFVAWSYRRELKRQIHEWTADPSGIGASGGGGGPSDVGAAIRAIESLREGRADSVLLTAPMVAALVAHLADSLAPGSIDSVEIRLDNDDVEMRGVVDTRTVPVALGPLAGIVKDRERLEAGGRIVFRNTGSAEWQVDRVRVRGLPIPRELFGRLLQRFSSRAQGGTIPFRIPTSVTGLRVVRSGVVLYGRGAGR